MDLYFDQGITKCFISEHVLYVIPTLRSSSTLKEQTKQFWPRFMYLDSFTHHRSSRWSSLCGTGSPWPDTLGWPRTLPFHIWHRYLSGTQGQSDDVLNPEGRGRVPGMRCGSKTSWKQHRAFYLSIVRITSRSLMHKVTSVDNQAHKAHRC